MSRIVISCTDQKLEILEADLIASGGVNEVTVVFNFCHRWTGFAKTGVFYAGGDAANARGMVLDSDNSCKVPWEVMADSGTLSIGVFGVKGDVIRTSNMVKIKVRQGTPRVETVTGEPTPSVYEQMLNRLYGVHIGSEPPTDENIMAWIDPDGETGGRTYLWGNPQPGEFRDEEILIEGLGLFDAIEIEYGSYDGTVSTARFRVNDGGRRNLLNEISVGDNTVSIRSRTFDMEDFCILTFSSGSAANLVNGVWTTVRDDFVCVPQAIFGIREVW